MMDLVIVCLLILGGLVFGKYAEKRHYRRIIAREADLNRIPAIASRYPPTDAQYDQVLVAGNVVIASDYFKRTFAALLNIFGGRQIPYETLLDRARRESVLRMKENADAVGATMIFNVKFETSSIGNQAAASMETLAYGTALVPRESPGEV